MRALNNQCRGDEQDDPEMAAEKGPPPSERCGCCRAPEGSPHDQAAHDAYERAVAASMATEEPENIVVLAAKRTLLDDIATFLSQFVDQEGYGAFPGGDPRLFRPDPECSTAREREAHRLACEAWERGERPDITDGCCLVTGTVEGLAEPVVKVKPRPRRGGHFPVVVRGAGGAHVAECLGWPRLTAEGATVPDAVAALKIALKERLGIATDEELEQPRDVTRTAIWIDDPEGVPVEEPAPVGFGLGSYRYSDDDVAALLVRVREAGEVPRNAEIERLRTIERAAKRYVQAHRDAEGKPWGCPEGMAAHDAAAREHTTARDVLCVLFPSTTAEPTKAGV